MKFLKNISKIHDMLSGPMFHMHAFAAESEQQSCSNSMYKLSKNLKVGNCILLSLQDKPNFVLGSLETRNAKHRVVFRS